MFRIEIERTEEFIEWFDNQDPMTRAKIEIRLDRIANDGHFGFTNIFDGIIELKWKNGLRVYTAKIRNTMIVVLGGGNKNGQSKDIKKAKKILEKIRTGSFTQVRR